jgi:prephenate dehydratase
VIAVNPTSSAPSIAYQGEPGSNSQIACEQARPHHVPLACATFEDAFAAVSESRADLAMIPIENSTAGRVADIHALLPTSGLHIVGEHFLAVHFGLLAVPGARIEDLRSVRSHIHALSQCHKIIRELNLKAIVSGDTAGSAREVAEAGDPTQASLAPAAAAQIYGLKVLADDVEDEPNNATRFIVLARQELVLPPAPQIVTSFVFRVRNLPAALYKALGGFATNSVNMTKLESYMVGGAFTATLFYAEVEGHPDEPALARALEELAFFSQELLVLGVFPAAPFRVESDRFA